jgi:hypothetical protein
MPMIAWRDLPPLQVERPMQVNVPWLHAFDSLGDGTHVRILAFGKWQITGDGIGPCPPDGLAGATVDATRLLVPDSPLGALLGKFGGSSATFSTLSPPPAPTAGPVEGQAFTIGAQLVTALPAKSIRQLYLGFNDLKRPIQLIALRVQVSVATPTF